MYLNPAPLLGQRPVQPIDALVTSNSSSNGYSEYTYNSKVQYTANSGNYPNYLPMSRVLAVAVSSSPLVLVLLVAATVSSSPRVLVLLVAATVSSSPRVLVLLVADTVSSSPRVLVAVAVSSSPRVLVAYPMAEETESGNVGGRKRTRIDPEGAEQKRYNVGFAGVQRVLERGGQDSREAVSRASYTIRNPTLLRFFSFK